MVKIPPYLKKGDTIGIVCPAGYMALEKVLTCITTLQEWGYKVKVGNTVGGASQTYFSGTDEERLNDFQQMMDDNEVQAILCGRGGYGTGRIIDKIDFKKFKKRPKWIIGYSDITILHAHLLSRFNISSLHAPMAAAFNDKGKPDDPGYLNESLLSLKNVLAGKKMNYTCQANEANRKGESVGELAGGNLSLLAHLAGTPSAYSMKGKILFIEDIGEQLYNIDRMMYQLKRSGKLAKLAGLIFGGFTDVKDTDRPFGKPVHEILKDITREYHYPVCFDFPVSHTSENYALKTGVKCKLKITKNKTVLREL